MSGAGVPDFFYREAQRLGYVARSAFKLLQMQKQYKLIKPGSSVLDLGCAPGAWLQVACQSLGPIKNGGVVVGVDIKFAEQKVKVPTMYCDSRVQTTSADVMSLPRSQVRALSPQNKGFSVILSDMCPPVSGISTRDAAISIELGMQALDLAVGGTVSAHLRGDDDIQMEVGTEASSSNSDAIGSSSACSSSKPDDEGILKKGGNLVVKLLESQDVQGENIHSPVQSSLLIVKECSDQLTSFPELGLLCKPLFKKASWLRPKATRPSSREIYLICQGFGDKCK